MILLIIIGHQIYNLMHMTQRCHLINFPFLLTKNDIAEKKSPPQQVYFPNNPDK